MDTVSLLCQMFGAVLLIILAYKLTRSFLRKVINPNPFRLTTSCRKLGKFEETMELFSDERQGTTNTCYGVTLHSKEKLRESLVRDALFLLAKRQPMLRAVIKTTSNSVCFGQNTERYFEIIEPSKVGDMIDLTTSDLLATQWQKAWYEIASRTVRPGNLLWQTVLFKEEYHADSQNYVNTIVFRVNHSIIDGVSGMKLCKQFLSHLNNISGDPRLRNQDVPSLELLPSLYEIISNTRSWSLWWNLQESLGLHYLYKFIIRLKLRISLARKPEKPYDCFMTEPSPEPGDLVYKVFSESETSQIRKVCKSNGATVTGALMAAAHIAFCKIIECQSSPPLQNVVRGKKLLHLFAINGLRVCQPKPPVEYLGNFLFSEMLRLSYETDNDAFWSLAQEASTNIQTKVKEGKYVSAGLAGLNIFTPKEILEELASPVDLKKKLKMYDIGNYISSAGAFTFDEDDSDDATFKLHECLYYSIPFGYASFCSQFNVTVNGKMTWVVICSDFVRLRIGEQFGRCCFETLTKAVNEHK